MSKKKKTSKKGRRKWVRKKEWMSKKERGWVRPTKNLRKSSSHYFTRKIVTLLHLFSHPFSLLFSKDLDPCGTWLIHTGSFHQMKERRQTSIQTKCTMDHYMNHLSPSYLIARGEVNDADERLEYARSLTASVVISTSKLLFRSSCNVCISWADSSPFGWAKCYGRLKKISLLCLYKNRVENVSKYKIMHQNLKEYINIIFTSPTSQTQTFPESSPARIWWPLGFQMSLLTATPPSIPMEAVGSSVSLFRFQRSIRPIPSAVAKSAGWIGDHLTS